MRWQGRRGSANIEDRRRSRKTGTGRGRKIKLPSGASKLSPKAIVLVVGLLVVAQVMGVDVVGLLSQEVGTSQSTTPQTITKADERAGRFVSVTLADTEEVWAEIFREQVGRAYRPVTLVLFKGVTPSPCGNASGATGPFYCPGDQKAYLDTDFFVTLSRRLGAGGDVAQAYVIAHEVAHHVQNELDILEGANRERQRSSKVRSNAISVQIELQADCFSGIWARKAEEMFGSLEKGDLEEALNAARAIGDDTLQRNAGKRPMPHTFTHGTSQQRQKWFDIGYKSAEIRECDTFSASKL